MMSTLILLAASAEKILKASIEAYQSFGGYREGAAVPQTEHKDTDSSDIYYGDEEPRVINKIVYCHKDGTVVATLWEESQNLPILNSEK